MTERGWTLEDWDDAVQRWKRPADPAASRPDGTLVGVVEGWGEVVRKKGLPDKETVMTDEGDFVVRVMGTQTIVAGVVRDFASCVIKVYSVSGV